MVESSTAFTSPPDVHSLILSTASLFEGSFSIDWIEALTGAKASQVLAACEEGIQEGWLTREGPGVFRFADQTERLRLQDRFTQAQKEQHHQHIAELLMRELPDDDGKAELLAPHLFNTSLGAEKAYWVLRAGDAYLAAFRTEEALACYTKVLDELSGLEGEMEDSLFTAAALKYSKVSAAQHDTTKVLSLLKEAMSRAERWDKKAWVALLHMHMAKNEWFLSRYGSAERHFEQGWALAKTLDDPRLLRQTRYLRVLFLYWQGRFREIVSSYEKSVPPVDRYPQDRFRLIGDIMLGHCYAHLGQVTQGLGRLDAIRTHCREMGDLYMASQAGIALGYVLLDMRRTEDAIRYFHQSLEEAIKGHNSWARILGSLMLAFVYYLTDNTKQSMRFLKEFLTLSSEVQVTVWPHSYLMELCWAMEQGKLPRISGLSLEQEVSQVLKGRNVFMRGVAYRFQALLERKGGLGHERIIRSLNRSLKYLRESGHQFELARSLLELTRQYTTLGEMDKAREAAQEASTILCPVDEGLLPDDLRPLISAPPEGDGLLREIMQLGQEVVTIRDNQQLVQHIISTVNRVTGAERGAIFLVEGDHPPTVELRASKNLTAEQVSHPQFGSSMDLIEEVVATGKGRLKTSRKSGGVDSPEGAIRSSICVPMILRGKVVGVLYHDNRLLSSAFRDSDMELLSYFASQAAFALENAQVHEENRRLTHKLQEEKRYYEEKHLESLHFEDIVGESAGIKQVLAQVDQVATSDTTVLILGETGVGKELIASAIHRRSPRHDKPLIRVNCSALPEQLISSELFGHERGAFTGATQRRVGRFELAHGGTLFLDEIGDLPTEVQIQLLRVIQTREFERVGGTETLRSDFRLIVATNSDLEGLVEAGKFRRDLYYRLNVFPISLPPLRERREDIPLLAHYFLTLYGAKRGKSFEGIRRPDMDKLLSYEWPGNIRELENIIERGTILSEGPVFQLAEFTPGGQQPTPPRGDLTLEAMERRHILWALNKTGWKVRGPGGAAELVDMHYSTLTSRMKKLGIQRPQGIPKRRGSLTSVP